MSNPATQIVDLKSTASVKAIKSLLTIVTLTSICILGFSSRYDSHGKLVLTHGFKDYSL